MITKFLNQTNTVYSICFLLAVSTDCKIVIEPFYCLYCYCIQCLYSLSLPKLLSLFPNISWKPPAFSSPHPFHQIVKGDSPLSTFHPQHRQRVARAIPGGCLRRQVEFHGAVDLIVSHALCGRLIRQTEGCGWKTLH